VPIRDLICTLVTAAALTVTSPVWAAQSGAPALIALHLKDGTVLIGYVVSENGGTIIFRSPALGALPVTAADVVRRGPADEAHVPEGAPGAASLLPVASTATSPWKRTVGVGAYWDSPPFTQGTVSGGTPGLTGAALRLPGAQLHAEVNVAANYAKPNRVVALWGGFAYTDSQPIGRQTEATEIGLQFIWPLTSRTYLTSRGTADRDVVRHIAISFAELIGVGFKAIQTSRLRADVVGGGALLFEQEHSRFDDTYQPQLGAMETVVYQLSPRASISHWILYRVGVRESELWSVESHTGLQGAITSWLMTDISLTWNYDNLLGDAITPVPANALFPGSPALALLANQRTIQRITSSVKFTF
jgi:hypothetical protein